MRFAIQETINKLPISKLNRMEIGLEYRILRDKLKLMMGIEDGNLYIPSYYPLVLTNLCFGNEYILKRYAEFNDYIYAIIEHGLYLGNNASKVTDERDDYELKSIITLSNYRLKTIRKSFPDFQCYTVGPMIHYAQFDPIYLREIRDKMIEGKTMLYFPVHGNGELKVKYDKHRTLSRVIDVARTHNCSNVIVCVFKANLGETDEFIHFASAHKDINIIITSCGYRYDEKFLDRQKTLISVADYTISNRIGTHLGYCIYMNKPHYLIDDNLKYEATEERLKIEFGRNNRSENWKTDFEREEKLFLDIFSDLKKETVSDEQYEICKYFWGFDCVREPDELKELLTQCKTRVFQHIK